jgi:hypothetical protein
MKSKTFTALMATPLCLALFSTKGHAQSAPVTGTIISKSVTTGSNSTVVLAAPAKGNFIVTQFCASTNNVSLVGQVSGFIATTGTSNLVGGASGINCVSFSPGYAVKTNEQLLCQRNGNPAGLQCSVSGVLEAPTD